MDLDPRVALELAISHRGRQGLDTDGLARVIRRRLPDFLVECEREAQHLKGRDVGGVAPELKRAADEGAGT